MIAKKPLLLILLSFLIFYFATPTILHSIRLTPDVNQYKCLPRNGAIDPDSLSRPSNPPVIKTIQLTDDGELVDRCQWTDALNELAKKRPDHAPQSTITVLYIHGWKHDSTSDDRKKFEALIKDLTTREISKSLKTRRHVVGIYLAWDASFATKIPILEHLTFWSRKRAADRIAQSGMLAKLIGAIENIQNLIGNCDQPNLPGCRNRTILIGHSFGARILHSATSGVFLNEVQRSHPGPKRLQKNTLQKKSIYKCIGGPAESVILLNPAMEASMFTALYSTRRIEEKFDPRQQPRFFSISTENDFATKFAFPLGQLFGWVRGERNTTTLGNYVNYRTHFLVSPKHNLDQNPTRNASWSDNFCGDNLCLKVDLKNNSQTPIQERNPFVVAFTSKDIMDGHNGHWDRPIRKWIFNLIVKLDEELDVNQANACIN